MRSLWRRHDPQSTKVAVGNLQPSMARRHALYLLLIFGAFCLFIVFQLSSSLTFAKKIEKRQKTEVILKKALFPQGGGDVKFNQPWRLPKLKNVIREFPVQSEQKLLFSNFSYSKGLGNQMFQVASLLEIAKGVEAKLVLPESLVLRRGFDLQLNENIIFAEETVVNGVLEELQEQAYTLKECCKYENIEVKFQNNVAVVNGYFHNKGYFHPSAEVSTKETFDFLEDIKKRATEFIQAAFVGLSLQKAMSLPGIEGVDEAVLTEDDALNPDVFLVGVHARRGMDITYNDRNIKHGHTVASEEYYAKAIEKAVEGKDKDKTIIIVCTDNLPWAKSFFDKRFGFVIFCPGRNREEDMAILLKVDSLIISTGTFSWWTAYMSENSQQVFYYENWPRPGSPLDAMVNKDEYFMSSWIPLS